MLTVAAAMLSVRTAGSQRPHVGCAPGKYRDVGGCFDCPAGKQQPHFGQSRCTSCTTGTYSYPAARVCSSCSQLIPCPQHYFRARCKQGHGICAPCPRCGAAQQLEGCSGESPGKCVCRPGSIRTGSRCVPCPSGRYKPVGGLERCLQCLRCAFGQHIDRVCRGSDPGTCRPMSADELDAWQAARAAMLRPNASSSNEMKIEEQEYSTMRQKCNESTGIA